MIQVVLMDGSIIDGTGRPPFTTDIAIVGDRIALIGDLSSREAVRRIDCRGAVVAPGFIDACSHTDEGWLTLPQAPSKVMQGVTSEVAGNCGNSRLFGAPEWPHPDGFFGAISRNGVSPNVSTLVGYNDALTQADAAAAIRIACEAGAIGVSIDLRATSTGDAIVAMQAARDAGAPRAAVHLRDDGDGVIAALDEAIDCARRANVALHVSHHRIQTKRHTTRMEQTLERIDRARSRGSEITCDLYPYVTTWIELASLLPEAIRERDDLAALLSNPDTVVAIAMEMQARLGELWHDVMLAEVGGEQNMAWCGMRLDDVARARRLSPARATLELIRQEGARARAFFFSLQETDIATLLSADFATIGTDAPAYGLQQSLYGNPHPRAFGTFPRIMGRFVRRRRTLSPEEAIRRMTGLPARTFGLGRRGEVAVGNFADLVIFDEATFVDTATYDHAVSFPKGVAHVFVNGVPIVSRGSLTNERPGRVLRGGR